MTDRARSVVYLSVTCAICSYNGIVKWSEGKGGTNPPGVWLCLDHEVNK